LQPKQKDEAFASLVHRQSRFVFRVAYALLRHPHDAEDVVQETFLDLYRSNTWQEIKDERAFLARAAWRQAVDRLRRNPQRREEEMVFEFPSPSSSPEQALLDADSEAAIHRMIDALPEQLRQPLALSSIDELNSREIAGILDVPEGTVRTRLMRARQMLKLKLSAHMETRYAK
jgi:RNA polymerase sigma-70 factor (ECF subfamily)